MASSRGQLSSSSSTSSLDELGYAASRPSRIDLTRENESQIRNDLDHQSGPEMSKREENPFSFKNFLKKDVKNYEHAGARPKEYPSRVPASGAMRRRLIRLESEDLYPRNPTELPDFVQDHLVIEQCFLGHDNAAGTQMISDIDNLPDFALSSVEARPLRHQTSSKNTEPLADLPLDLTGSLNSRQDSLNLSVSPPVDLSNDSATIACSPSPRNEANIPKSLPDFLSDGPIRNRVAPQSDLSPNITSNSSEPLDRRLQHEIERLRQELEVSRQQNREKNHRIQSLEAELSSRRAVDHEETAHLEKAMEQVEDNLKRSTRRAVNAENTVTALKQEIKALLAENSALRTENIALREAVGVGSSSQRSLEVDTKIHSVAGDLREAASSAESLLRQLISGVDNLKVIASTLENIGRIEDRTKDFLLDFDDDNAAGPAL